MKLPNKDIDLEMYNWAKDLFPINRSLTGEGVRQTLIYLQNIIPELKIKYIKSGTKVFDWTIPLEWNVTDAYIVTPSGKKIAEFKKNNLHLMGYSKAVNKEVTFDELRSHLFTIEELPEAIPYVTSYYKRDWGFCITSKQFKTLKKGTYKVYINSSLKKGHLNYAELIIPGREDKEILISTYICHPSLANNELSGPVVTTQLVKWLKTQNNLRYTYRIVFLPETIGSISYIKYNYEAFKKKIFGGFVVTCVGDNNNYSLLTSKYENTVFDKIGLNVMKYHCDNNFNKYSFLERGSDERQYSSVGVDVPIISLMRSKYGEYKEYHNSLDNLDFISPEGLFGGFEIHRKMITLLENNFIYKMQKPCEPQLGKRGLYPSQSTKDTHKVVETMMNFIAYADGQLDLISIANKINADGLKCIDIANELLKNKLIKKYKNI